MSWYWWVLFVFMAYGLGLLGSLYFQKTHPPDRRRADRRTIERRSSSPGTVAPAGVERRAAADRRTGADRRKGKPIWQLATVVVAGVFLSIIGVVAYAESQVASIFADSNPALINSGWAACDTPITWSVDTSRLKPDEAAAVQKQLEGELQEWTDVSGLKFQFAGEVPVKYDDSTFVVTSDQHPSERHLYFAFLNDSESSLLDKQTVGFASPTKVWQDSKEITEGSIVLEIEYMRKVNADKGKAVYLHEIGHALGLAHGTEKADVMYPIVDGFKHLSAADIAGMRAIIKACKG